MFCRKCGNEIDDDSEFCVVCGEKVSASAELPKSEPASAVMTNTSISSENTAVKKGINKKIIIGGAIGVVVIVTAVILIAFFTKTKADDKVSSKENNTQDAYIKDGEVYNPSVVIPTFVELNIDSVQQDWQSKLKFEVINEYNSQYDEGIITKQSIEQGKTVKEGTAISLTVSKGEQMAVIPDVAGGSQDDAKSELEAKGFIVIIRKTYDDNAAQGLAVKTQPEAGSNYPVGKEVTLFVSQGTLDTVKVPKVVGLTEERLLLSLRKIILCRTFRQLSMKETKVRFLIKILKKVKRLTEIR